MLNRLELLIGKENILKIKNKTFLIIGLGGVGGYALESLVRCGAKNVIIVDGDIIDDSNLNRQIIALNSNIGKYKVLEFEKRIKDINPSINVVSINEMIDSKNIDQIFKYKIDYLIDAEDTVNTKKLLIKKCIDKKIKIISVMGMGNRMDMQKVYISNIFDNISDPMFKNIKKWAINEGISKKIPIVCSSENPKKTSQIGSNSYVPSVAGLLCTNYIINDILKEGAK